MNILVGYNGTNIGRDLLDLAIHRAKAYSGEIFIITSLIGSGKTTKEDISEAEKILQMQKNTWMRRELFIKPISWFAETLRGKISLILPGKTLSMKLSSG